MEKHPSQELQNLYRNRNFQGANPNDAKILFVGRDPNWAIDVEKMNVFEKVKEYLIDGVAFWNKHSVHHPFLLQDYKGDGKRYHRIFSKLEIDKNNADKISFVELIGIPTTGMSMKNSKKFYEYLLSNSNIAHLNELDKLINDSSKIIFIAWGLMKDFEIINAHTGLFNKIAKLNKDNFSITELNEFENIFIHRHFSDAISNNTINKMSQKLKHHLK